MQAFLDLGAECLIPMHFGTFRLSEEPMEEPVPRLLEAARKAGVEDRMFVMQEGKTAFFPPGDKTSQGPQSELVERAS